MKYRGMGMYLIEWGEGVIPDLIPPLIIFHVQSMCMPQYHISQKIYQNLSQKKKKKIKFGHT